MDSEIAKIYGNRLRMRVCGLCRDGEKLLLVNHRLADGKNFWAPPGGGVDFGHTVPETLHREFLEETNLVISVGTYAFGCEFLNPPLHAIEMFFNVSVISGELKTGYDPEIQIIQDVAYLTPDQILAIPPDERHGILRHYTKAAQLRNLAGFYRI